MHTYEFIFRCEECGKELKELIASPDVLTSNELGELGFYLSCTDADCRWTGERTGLDAEKILSASNVESVCR